MDKLKRNYDKLCKLKQSKIRVVEPKTLTKIENIINDAQPSDSAGRAQKQLVLMLCWNKTIAKKIISQHPQLVLWMTSREIQKFLNISELTLHWLGSKYSIRYNYALTDATT